MNIDKQYRSEWSTLIGPDPSRYCALIGPDPSRYSVLICGTLLRWFHGLCHNNTPCLSVRCYGMISGFHAQKESITIYAIKTQRNAPEGHFVPNISYISDLPSSV